MNEISVTDLSALTDAVIVDVREADEYADAHIPGVTHIPLSDFVARVGDVPDASPVYVVCAAGGRSAQAVEWLSTQGFDAVNVEGGTSAWRNSGLPVKKES